MIIRLDNPSLISMVLDNKEFNLTSTTKNKYYIKHWNKLRNPKVTLNR